jgi:hypothetical protein
VLIFPSFSNIWGVVAKKKFVLVGVDNFAHALMEHNEQHCFDVSFVGEGGVNLLDMCNWDGVKTLPGSAMIRTHKYIHVVQNR